MNSGAGADWVGLFDASRNIRVELTPTQAVVSQNGTKLFAYTGIWRWQQFTRGDKKGSFVYDGAGKWSEHFEGKVIFTFKETRHNKEQVTLFDESRGIEVKLTTQQAVVTAGNKTLLTYPGQLRR